MVPSQIAQLTTLDPEIGAQACADTALYSPPCPTQDPSAPLVRPHLKLTSGNVELRLWFLIGCSRSIQKETRGESGSLGVWDKHIHTTIYKIDINKDLLYSTGNSIFSNNLYEKRIRRMDTCIGITGSLCYTLETNTTL